MSENLPQVIGVDISKDHLDAHLHPSGLACRVTNDAAGHKQLLAWLQTWTIERIVFEATGPYHRLLERTLVRAGLSFAKVNPRQARRFAEATGRLAKTDHVDVAMLARLGAVLKPEMRTSKSAALDELTELVAARRGLVRDRTACLNRVKTQRLALLRRQAAQRVKQLDRQIAAVDQLCRGLIAADAALAERLAILMSIPGIGEATAVAILADMPPPAFQRCCASLEPLPAPPELGQLEHRQAASLAGLAPVARESGTWRGKSFIRGGRAQLRQALYMPALVALRFNAPMKAKYQELITAGKPAKVAITAIMRRLIVLANALLRDGRKWTPNAA